MKKRSKSRSRFKSSKEEKFFKKRISLRGVSTISKNEHSDIKNKKNIYDHKADNIRLKAKVIPYMFNPKDNKLYFLVGKELWTSPSSKYSFIGGTCDKGETIIECASRELYEETIGLFQKKDAMDYIKKIPNENIFLFKTRIDNKDVHTYIFFMPLIQDPVNWNLPLLFQTRKSVLDKVFSKDSQSQSKRVLTPEIRNSIKNLIDIDRDADRISKSFLKHFHELASIQWVSEKDFLDFNVMNAFLTRKLIAIFQILNFKWVLLQVLDNYYSEAEDWIVVTKKHH